MLDHYDFVRVAKGLDDSSEMRDFGQCCGWTGHNALTAIDASRIAEPAIPRGPNHGSATATNEVDRSDTLNLFTDSHALATQDAFVGLT